MKYVEDTVAAAEVNRKTHKEEIKDAYINPNDLDSSQVKKAAKELI